MPTFPVFAKSWQAPILVTLPTESTADLQHQAAAAAMCNALMAPPLNPCVMLRCSDGVAVNTSGTNLIIDKTDIIGSNVGNRSWWVQQHPSGQQICIAFDATTNPRALTAKFSQAGFTGGTLTARPTATDEYGLASAGSWFSGGSGTGRFQIILLHSTDGKLTYGFILYRGILVSTWWIGEILCRHTAWSPPVIGWVDGAASLTPTTLNTLDFPASSDRIAARAAGGTMFVRATQPYIAGSRLNGAHATRRSRSKKWQLWPVGAACVNSPRDGVHGRFPDIFHLPDSTPVGQIYRSPDGATALVSIGGSLAIPWPPDLEPAFGFD
jgi:hypothetical protein